METGANRDGISEAPISTASATPGPLSDALREAIVGSGLTTWEIAFRSGAHVSAVGKFIRREAGLRLSTADKLALILGVGILDASGDGIEPHPGTLADALRAAIAACGIRFHALAGKTGLQPHEISLFARGRRGLLLTSADRLAEVLGLKLGRRAAGQADGRRRKAGGPRPITEALRAALAERGIGLTPLARQARVHEQSLRRFAAGASDLCLASVDGLLGVLEMGVVVADDEAPRASLSDALRAAIAGNKRSINALSKEADVMVASIGHFIRREGDMKLGTAERLCCVLGIGLSQRRSPPAPGPAPDPESPATGPLDPIADALRAAIAACGLSFYALAKRSGISAPTISRFQSGKRAQLGYGSAVKLADALGIDLGTAMLRSPSAMAETPAGPVAAEPGDSGIQAELSKLGEKRAQVVRVLIEAGPDGLTGAAIRNASGVSGWWRMLRDLKQSGPYWGTRIIFPADKGKKGGSKYRIKVI